MSGNRQQQETARPALTVVLTVYNTGECLAECLDDILAQTFSDYEVVCIDDGSTDDSPEILTRYQSRFPTFRLFRQKNAGPAAARNAGMDHARGDYLMLLDSDDRFEPTLFERMLDAVRAADADVAVCRADEFDHGTGKNRPTRWTVRDDLLPEGAPRGLAFQAADGAACPFSAFMGWPWDKVYRTGFIRDCDLRFPEQLPNAEDFPFVYLALCGAQRIVLADEVLIHHRVKRSGSTSNSRLASPAAFYEGVELVRGRLQGSEQWGRLEWGFLNWAMNYACWNIESLPAGSPQRAQLIDALFGGGMPALELDRHPVSYFSLHADVEWCLRRLRKEQETGRPCRKSIWEYLWVACKRMSTIGLGALSKQTAEMIRDR